MHCIGSCFGVSFYVGRGRLVLWDSPRKQSTALLRTLARTGVQRPFRGLTRRCHGFGPRSHGLFVDPTLLIVTRGWHRPRQCTRCRVTISGVSQVTDGAGKYIDGLQVKVSNVALWYTQKYSRVARHWVEPPIVRSWVTPLVPSPCSSSVR